MSPSRAPTHRSPPHRWPRLPPRHRWLRLPPLHRWPRLPPSVHVVQAAPSAQVAQAAPSAQVAQQCSLRATQPCYPAPVTQSRSYALATHYQSRLQRPYPLSSRRTGVTAGLLRTGITKQGSTAVAHSGGADWCSGSPCPSIQPSSAVTRRARDDRHWNFIG